MKKCYFILIFIFFSFLIPGLIFAQEELPPGVTFPIAELGNCGSKAECEAYCDLPENMSACLDFAESQNLIPKEEIEMARKMLEMGDIGGPGGCKGKVECETYCDNPDHMEECIIFAKEHGLIPPEELEDVEKVLAAIQKGARPPACHGKAACDAYCSAPEHFEECITFGEAAGLIPPDEIDDARKALEAVRKGVKPPPCRGEVECDEYCAAPEHLEECLTFAEAAGFISAEEAAMVRRTGGKGPGGCRGKEVCEAYCEDPAHAEECINFAVENGFMSAEEAENAKKMLAAGLTGGPGGCKGKEECEAYCDDLAHMEECVDFAEKMGFMTSEDADRARRMAERGINVMQGGPGGCQGKEECEAFCQDPANMETCIDFAVQIGEMTPEEAEQAKKGMEAMQMGGPGGCRSEEECKAYCDDPSHSEECMNFAIEQGIISPEEAQQMREMMGPPPEGIPSGVPPGEMLPPAGEFPEGVVPSEQMLPGGIPPELLPPGGFIQPPSAEEIERIQQQAIEEAQRMMEQGGVMPPEGIMPPPEGATPPPETPPPPQSLLNQIKNFLASIISALGF